MSDPPTTCPRCGSTEIHFRKSRGDWSCDPCEHKWTPAVPADSSPPPTSIARLFLSYGRRDAEELADRLDQNLSLFGYEVWRDMRKIRSGTDFMREIEDGLRSTQLVMALLSSHAVRESGDANSPDAQVSANLEGPPPFRSDNIPPRPRFLRSSPHYGLDRLSHARCDQRPKWIWLRDGRLV